MLHIFKNKVQSPRCGLYNVEELNYVVVSEFTQERDFANDVAWHTSFGCGVRVGDSFDGDGAVRGALGSFVDCPVRSLTD